MKKFNTLRLQKVLVFTMTLLLFTGFIVGAIDLMNSSTESGIVPEYDYLYSNDFRFKTESMLNWLKEYIYYYKNEENIRAGNFISNLNSDYNFQVNSMFENYLTSTNYYLENNNRYINTENYNDVKTEAEMRSAFEREKKKELEELRNDHINMELSRFEGIKRDAKAMDPKEIVFYASNGKDTITNTSSAKSSDYKKYSVYLLIDRDGVDIGNDRAKENLEPMVYGRVYHDLVEEPRYADNKYKIYIGFNDQYISSKMDSWQSSRSIWETKVQRLAIISFIFILCLIRLIFITGRNSQGQVELRFIDRIYTEVNLLLCLGLIGLWFAFIQQFHIGIADINLWGINSLTVITFSLGAVGLVLVLSLIRHIKTGSLISNALFYKVFARMGDFFSRIYNSSSAGKKLVIILIVYPIVLGLTIFIFPITMALAIFLALRKAEDFEKIQEGVKTIRDGDLDYKIEIEREGNFKDLAEDINYIGEGLKNAVDNELISERHRTELISNVSHDIRTPLTSIITYIDLLKQEGDGPRQREYVEILDKKSKRLKKLIDDLFEASKVSSGNIPVNFSQLNLTSLITQGIGEVSDKIEERQLEFIINHPREELMVRADGGLLWRAIENLLSNIFKYGLESSRVYIDLEDLGDTACLVIKNISAYKLNISEEELMERFKRGDQSRTSEGSGLGLSIAESLIKLQEGKFFIEIDGDLFKTTIILAKA